MLALSGAACVLDPESIGMTLSGSATGESLGSTSEGETVTVGDTSTSEGETVTVGDTSTSGAASAYGAPCELEGITPEVQVTAMGPQEACEGGICLFAFSDEVVACDDDADCSAQPPYLTCGENGLCVLDPDFVAAETRCTQTCEADDECPDMPGCGSAVACVPHATLGPLCCEKVCTCLDNLSVSDAEFKLLQCENDSPCP